VDDTHPDYHFMRDQYLELLWAAQRVEDRRLTELDPQASQGHGPMEMTVAPAPACEIIPFPGIIVHSCRRAPMGMTTSGCSGPDSPCATCFP
jgi:hypothetical protein